MATASEQPLSAFGAFQSQLKTLCIKEFPCGLGDWREPDAKLQKPKKIRLNTLSGILRKPPPPDINLLKEPGPERERTEALQELVGSNLSPWHLDYSWSHEAKELREVSVKSPWLIDHHFILSHFRTLKIVDKGVTEVDKRLLELHNLTELTLTANLIRSVNSKYLPSSLQVLELCANEISDISALCVRPPLLLHLGLGYNCISFIDDYITGDYWPALLSLDLSNNNLTDLLDIVRKMSTLPKLRNLILLGNPLSLIPGYRGYTIDSLRRLSVLDDIRITADEWHHFKGLARRREYILDEAKVALGATFLRGVPQPEELKHPEDQPEYPVVERNYYVKFMFPADLSAHSHSGRLPPHEQDFDDLHLLTDPEHLDMTSDMQSARLEGSQQSESHTEKNVLFSQQQPETKVMDSLPLSLIDEGEEPPRSASAMGGSLGGQQEDGKVKDMEGQGQGQEVKEEEVEAPSIPLAPITSVSKPWAEEIELEWTVDVTRFDLTALRDFFRQGMDFSVVEEMVLCYPMEEEENLDTPMGSKKSKDGAKDKKDAKGKGGASAGKDKAKEKGGKDEKGKKKKKGEPEVELRREPPKTTTLAAFHIPLAHFVEGEFDFRSVFTQGGVEVAPSTARSASSADPKRDKKDAKDKKKGKDDKKDSKGGKDDKKDAKGKKGGHPPAPAEDNDETPPPPPPLEVEVSVHLHHWTTAMDSLKEEDKIPKDQ